MQIAVSNLGNRRLLRLRAKEPIALLCALAGAACDGGASDRVEESGGWGAAAPVHSQGLYVDEAGIWHQQTISVCWNNFDVQHPEVHEWVKMAVENSWSFVANVRFVGWDKCSILGADVRISVGNDLHPAVVRGLETLLGTTMRLNFKQDAGYCGTGHPDETYQTCMDAIAIHEFGHVLAFAHEQNRQDTPDTCGSDPQGSNGTVTYGEWDADSIMNYCNYNRRAHPWLSESDIEGVQKYYGTGPRYWAAIGSIL